MRSGGRWQPEYLDSEHIRRIAHVAGLAEIKENDFNLNISRYVDAT